MKERTFTMDLTPNGMSSCVLMDGDDISGLLQGVVVRSHVRHATSVELQPAHGAHARVMARLPEAQILIVGESPADVCRQLARWIQHHPGCARVREGEACSCGLEETLAVLKGDA